MLDWNKRKQFAEVIGRAGLNHRLVNVWNPRQCISMAVFVPMTFEPRLAFWASIDCWARHHEIPEAGRGGRD
jgi:hypothetical protein